MSSDSLALFRKSLGNELGALAEQHYQHDLQSTDREALQKAASRVSMHTTIGSVVGLSLGLFLSFRLRKNRTTMFNAFRTSEKPVAVQFAGGRTEPLPDLTPMLKPSTLGDIATYTLFGLGGLFVGGETGLLTGGLSAQSAIKKDPEAKKRIEAAFRKFRAETLRLEADQLEKGERGLGM
ncbi:hypothetical protein D6D01_03278 [Aureobasidium pullulans]|uniref:Uncharacterized protein n=1 Tax=Aureobasidium pullulans TaxID=5580 RepID=A0A4S9LKV0_AURPU|nr:hypothetical protein D6D01_03278 [Aureobasidium pullulans]